MTTTGPRLTLLARAEIAGEPVHPGLRILQPCTPEPRYARRQLQTCQWCNVTQIETAFCPKSPVTPNADPMALIAAIDLHKWAFMWNAGTLWLTWSLKEPEKRAYADDFQTALLGAAVQATAGVADNWEACEPCGGQGSGKPGHDEFPIVWRTCDDCHGTGYLIKEPADV